MRRLPHTLTRALLSVALGVAVAAAWSHFGPPGDTPDTTTPEPTAPERTSPQQTSPQATANVAPNAPGERLASPLSPSPRGSGNPLVEQMLSVMQRRPNAVAKVRQRVRMGAHELVGAGQYWQQGIGNQRRSRWQLQTQVAGETSSLVQVFDSRYLWTDRNLPDSRRVSRVDMARLRRELNVRPGAGSWDGDAQPPERLLASVRGGMAQLLADLLDNFDFDQPHASRREGVDYWIVVGRWKPAAMADLWPTLAAHPQPAAHPHRINAWPAHLPHHVVLEAGREDLFPYRLEYRRAAEAMLADPSSGGGASRDPLASYEWFDVTFTSSLDARHFSYTATEIDWIDETSAAASRLAAALPLQSRGGVGDAESAPR